MIRRDDMAICGITKSLYDSMGIPSSLVYGNNN